MSTRLLFTGQRARPLVSFEFFPPRRSGNLSLTWAGIDKLLAAAPDFVSVTYGAGGSTRSQSVEVWRHIRQSTSIPAVAHLTCIGATRGQLAKTVRDLLQLGVRSFLALRGDLPQGVTPATYTPRVDELNRAVQLVELIRDTAAACLPDPREVSIAVAAYPGPDSPRFANDLAALRDKVAAGADYAITQVFLEADHYARLRERATAVGVQVPLLPGFVPLTDARRVQRVAELAGIEVPTRLAAALCIANPRDRLRAGLRATLDLIGQTLAAGAPGVHLYTFNRPRPSLDILEYLHATRFLSCSADRGVVEDLVEATLDTLTPVG